MERNDLYRYEILSQFERKPCTSNRIMTAKLGCSIKLAHDLIAELIRKGFVSVKKHNSRRWDYLLTANGISEKGRLTMEFLDFTFKFYHDARKRSSQLCRGLAESGNMKVAFLGTGQLAEIAYLGVKEWGLDLLEVYSGGEGGFLGLETRPVEMLSGSKADAIIVCLFDNARPLEGSFLPAGIPKLPNMHWIF